MPPQVTREDFEIALRELGHSPDEYRGKKLSIDAFCEIYGIEEDIVLEAIKLLHIDAHYDYRMDTLWVDALDAAHFYYCIQSEAPRFRAFA